MKQIAAKMTSKGQITVPKTVRDFLSLDTSDTVLFTLTNTEQVILTKAPIPVECPICAHIPEIQVNGTCDYCRDKTELEKFNPISVIQEFIQFFISRYVQVKVYYDKTGTFPVLDIVSEDEKALRYRDIFQIEAIRLHLENVEDLSTFDFSTIIDVLSLEDSKDTLKRKLHLD